MLVLIGFFGAKNKTRFWEIVFAKTTVIVIILRTCFLFSYFPMTSQLLDSGLKYDFITLNNYDRYLMLGLGTGLSVIMISSYVLTSKIIKQVSIEFVRVTFSHLSLLDKLKLISIVIISLSLFVSFGWFISMYIIAISGSNLNITSSINPKNLGLLSLSYLQYSLVFSTIIESKMINNVYESEGVQLIVFMKDLKSETRTTVKNDLTLESNMPSEI